MNAYEHNTGRTFRQDASESTLYRETSMQHTCLQSLIVVLHSVLHCRFSPTRFRSVTYIDILLQRLRRQQSIPSIRPNPHWRDSPRRLFDRILFLYTFFTSHVHTVLTHTHTHTHTQSTPSTKHQELSHASLRLLEVTGFAKLGTGGNQSSSLSVCVCVCVS